MKKKLLQSVSFSCLFLLSLINTSHPLKSASPTLNSFDFPQTVEEDILKVLTGEMPYHDQKITERRSLKNRTLVRSYLSEKLQSYGYSPLTQTYSSNGANVYAILSSTIPSHDHIVVGAHFDSVGNPGANDNATGVTLVLMMAERLSHLETRTKNIIFVFFDEEEKGLVGSQHFAEKLLSEKTQVHSVHTIDQMGFDADKDLVIELEQAPVDLFEVYQKTLLETKSKIQLAHSPIDSTDHKSFRDRGFKSIGLTEEYYNGDSTPCYHKMCDTYSTIDLYYLRQADKFWSQVIIKLMQ